MKKLLFFIISSIGVFGGVFLFFWNMAKKIQQPLRRQITSVPSVPYENIEFPSKEGIVRGWFIPSKFEETPPLIILCHGWGSSRDTVYRYVDRLHEEGYSLLLFDVRGHGESSSVKALTVKTFRDDIISAVKFAKSRKDIDTNNIGLLGHSFGGFGSILSLSKGNTAKAIVIDSSPIKFTTIMESFLKQKKLPTYPLVPILTKFIFMRANITTRETKEDLDCIKALENTRTPILMTHSINDNFVPSSELEYIKSRVKINSFYVKSDGHRDSQSDPDFWENVIPFFNAHLSMRSKNFISEEKNG
ncbi:alpha/beta hydrolase [Jeotgalibacillus proteolyticus]|uniref:alpha/beta hydrolase n=1 Tax=Jeotgalibacillus proteolyticus TaxID=2082395 RepID=UPI001430C116|nr:alpha/beta fold hydrolase [Jeotgalibacillus proteolyticus]